LERKQTHPIQLALPMPPASPRLLPESVRPQAIAILAELLKQVAKAAKKQPQPSQADGDDNAP